jgi:hypothetical protein
MIVILGISHILFSPGRQDLRHRQAELTTELIKAGFCVPCASIDPTRSVFFFSLNATWGRRNIMGLWNQMDLGSCHSSASCWLGNTPQSLILILVMYKMTKRIKIPTNGWKKDVFFLVHCTLQLHSYKYSFFFFLDYRKTWACSKSWKIYKGPG